MKPAQLTPDGDWQRGLTAAGVILLAFFGALLAIWWLA